MKKTVIGIFLLVLLIGITAVVRCKTISSKVTSDANPAPTAAVQRLHPLAIEVMRSRSYPGSKIMIEETLSPGRNYERYLASYLSDRLKIYALMTVPQGEKPKDGWPVILFNHGYIPPEVYQTTERYVAYVDAFARNGYIVFKPDFRGNGNSEGEPEGTYYSPAYTVDDLNALFSIKKYIDANPQKIGVWGHSMGGNIALRDLVVRPDDIKAVVIWAGVVGSYDDLINNWHRRVPYRPSGRELSLRNRSRQSIINQNGTPQSNPAFWNALDPTFYVADIIAPVQLHHGTADEEVPLSFSQMLFDKLKKNNKKVELYTYEGADHNIAEPAFDLAMSRSLQFFDIYLK